MKFGKFGKGVSRMEEGLSVFCAFLLICFLNYHFDALFH